MAIEDVDVRGSVGWWMQRMWKMLEAELPRLDRLAMYDEGRPPLPWASEQTATKFYRFQQTSRTNFAELLVDAPHERLGIRSISTAADEDVSGDPKAWRMLLANNGDIEYEKAARDAFRFGRGYLVTSAPDDDPEEDDEDYSTISSEDPRSFITDPDPLNSSKQRAAFKIEHDDTFGIDVATLWLPNHKYVAVRERNTPPRRYRTNADGSRVPEPYRVAFDPKTFDLRDEDWTDTGEALGMPDPYRSETYKSKKVPAQVLENKDGIGVFEQHIDILDRLNHMTFMLMVTMTMQAFRQRGLEQGGQEGVEPLPENDEFDRPINYDEMFESGPDSMWLLPPGSKMWESQQADLSGQLSAIKHELLKLSAVTRTPMSMLTPDAIAQSAEGAQLAREGIVFRVEQFQRSSGRALSRCIALGFEYMNDKERSDPAEITVNFLPAERYSLAEKGSAAAQAINSLPRETIGDVIWQLDPVQLEAAKTQWMEQTMQAQIAQQAAAGAQQPASDRPSKQSKQDPNNPRAAEGQGVATSESTNGPEAPKQ